MKQYIYHGKVFQFADEKVPKGAAIINEQPAEETEAAEKDKKNKAKGAQTK